MSRSGPVQLRVAPVIEELQRETQRHPKLMEQLTAPGAVKTFEDGIGIIAAYVDVALDGVYSGEDINFLCDKLVQRLRAKRGSIIIRGE